MNLCKMSIMNSRQDIRWRCPYQAPEISARLAHRSACVQLAGSSTQSPRRANGAQAMEPPRPSPRGMRAAHQMQLRISPLDDRGALTSEDASNSVISRMNRIGASPRHMVPVSMGLLKFAP